VSPSRILRVLASLRIRTPQGTEYEFVHAEVRPGPEPGSTEEAVLLRRGDGAGGEIRLQDLHAVQPAWSRFVADVLQRRAEAGDAAAREALGRIDAASASPAFRISASGGRHGSRGRVSGAPDPAPPPAISAGPRRRIGPPLGGPAEPAAPSEPESWHVLRFSISDPPDAEEVLAFAKARPRGLIAVAPAPLAGKAEAFVSDLKEGRASGLPDAFRALVIERRVNGRPVTHKQLQAEIAGALVRASGDLSSVLWILPE
jgi:hypothetical protein